MFEGGISLKSIRRTGSRSAHWLVGDEDVWVLMPRAGEDVAGLLREGETDLWICRAVLDGGVILLREADPTDPFLSDLLHEQEEKQA